MTIGRAVAIRDPDLYHLDISVIESKTNGVTFSTQPTPRNRPLPATSPHHYIRANHRLEELRDRNDILRRTRTC